MVRRSLLPEHVGFPSIVEASGPGAPETDMCHEGKACQEYGQHLLADGPDGMVERVCYILSAAPWESVLRHLIPE